MGPPGSLSAVPVQMKKPKTTGAAQLLDCRGLTSLDGLEAMEDDLLAYPPPAR